MEIHNAERVARASNICNTPHVQGNTIIEYENDLT